MDSTLTFYYRDGRKTLDALWRLAALHDVIIPDTNAYNPPMGFYYDDETNRSGQYFDSILFLGRNARKVPADELEHGIETSKQYLEELVAIFMASSTHITPQLRDEFKKLRGLVERVGYAMTKKGNSVEKMVGEYFTEMREILLPLKSTHQCHDSDAPTADESIADLCEKFSACGRTVLVASADNGVGYLLEERNVQGVTQLSMQRMHNRILYQNLPEFATPGK